MSCPSAIYTVLTNATVEEGGSAGFGSVIRRYGPSVRMDGQGLNTLGGGYYAFDTSLTFTPTATGPVTIQFYQDGVAIPGALATEQGTAATPLNLSVPFMVRNIGPYASSAITYAISAAGVINNLPVVVEKK